MKFRSLKQIRIVAIGCAALGCITLTLAPPVLAQITPGQEGPPPGEMRGGMGRGMGVRGTVTAIAGGQVTIKTDEGDLYKVITGENTRVMKERQPAAAADIKVGDMLMVGGQV